MTGELTPQHHQAASRPLSREGRDDFQGVLRDIARTRSSITTVFADFCRIAACCLALQTREDEYHRAIRGYSKHELGELARALGLLIDEMNGDAYADVLGQHYVELISPADRTARGEFFTPRSVSRMMAEMCLDIERIKSEGRPITLGEPCGGSGGIVLACAQALAPDHVDLLRVTLQDCNPVACDMAYINTTLWGVPAEIILGDTLRLETQARWTNIHWHRVGEAQRRQSLRMLEAVRSLDQPTNRTEPESPKAPETKLPGPGVGEQLDLF